MASIPALVEPAVIEWARTSVGLSPVAAARKLKVPDGRVAEWEAGERLPTIAELKRATKIYRRSLGVFFLPEPPTDFDTLRDFRLRPGVELSDWSVDLHAEYRRAHDQRDVLLELYELEDVRPPSAWRLAETEPSDERLAASARAALLANSPARLPSGGSDRYAHLSVWTTALEAAGVLVFASAGGRIDTEEMAGFSLYWDELPVIVVNGADWPRGRLFSLLHEYAHLLLHSEGLCDGYRLAEARTPDQRLESRCNDLAARMLMPEDAVRARPEVLARIDRPTDWDYESLRDAAAPFGVSAESFLRRLVTIGLSTPAYYSQRRDEFLEAYRRQESTMRSKGKGNFYFNKARDLGKGYVRQVDRARSRTLIDSTTAARVLGVKVQQLAKLADAARISGSVRG